MNINRLVLPIVVVGLFVGCSNRGAEMEGQWKMEPWPSVDVFAGEGEVGAGTIKEIDYAVQAMDWNKAKSVAGSEEFEKSLNTFAAAEIPAVYASFSGDKDKAVESCREMIKVAREGNVKDFQEAYSKFMTAFQDMRLAKVRKDHEMRTQKK